MIPHPSPNDDGGFFGIKSGKTHPAAAMTFIGRSITADDIIEKIQKPIPDPGKVRNQFEEFLGRLQDFKFGNVISISYEADGAFTLSLEATRPPSQNRKSLP